MRAERFLFFAIMQMISVGNKIGFEVALDSHSSTHTRDISNILVQLASFRVLVQKISRLNKTTRKYQPGKFSICGLRDIDSRINAKHSRWLT